MSSLWFLKLNYKTWLMPKLLLSWLLFKSHKTHKPHIGKKPFEPPFCWWVNIVDDLPYNQVNWLSLRSPSTISLERIIKNSFLKSYLRLAIPICEYSMFEMYIYKHNSQVEIYYWRGTMPVPSSDFWHLQGTGTISAWILA